MKSFHAGKWSRWARSGSPADTKHNQKVARTSSSTQPRQAARAQPPDLIDYASVIDSKPPAAASSRSPGRKPASIASRAEQAARPLGGEALLQSKRLARLATKSAFSPPQRASISDLVSVPAVAADTAVTRLWRQYYRPAALVFASAHILATACAVTGGHAGRPLSLIVVTMCAWPSDLTQRVATMIRAYCRQSMVQTKFVRGLTKFFFQN